MCDCSNACNCVYVCIYVCVRACGVNGVKLPRLRSLGGVSFFLSLSPFFFPWSCVVWWFL